MEHVLLVCSWVRRVWLGGPLSLRIDDVGLSSFREWWGCLLERVGDQSDFVGCYVAFSCWNIWRVRCDFIFEGIPIDPSLVCSKINFAIWEFWSHLFPVKNLCGLC